MRPASIDSALSQPPSSACRPKSPKVTAFPRWALPRTLPRALLRNFTLLGIKGMATTPSLASGFRTPVLHTGVMTDPARPFTLPARLAPVAAAVVPRAGGRRRRELRLLDQVVAVVNPHLDADVALRRLGLREAELNPGSQGGQRDAAGHGALGAGHFCAAEPAGHLDPDALGPVLHRRVDGPLERAAEAGPLLQLLGNVLRHQLSVDFRAVHLHRLDLDVAVGQVFQLGRQLVDLMPLLADDHADPGRSAVHHHLLA